VLTRGAAYDAAARDRFVTAIREAGGRERSGLRGRLGRPGRSRGAVLDGAPEVLAYEGGRAPWVAVPYAPGQPGAEWFLDPVMVGGTFIGAAHGPDFVPYWLTDRAPALPGPGRPPRPLTETRKRVLLAALTLVLLLLLVTVILLVMLLGRRDSEPQPRQLPPTVFVPTPPPTPETPVPQPSPSLSPSPSQSGPSTPGRSPGEDPGDEAPL
ncbi:hypothetical protein AB0J43_50110, partial [Nonomuraea fuscirosea]